ncbi:MATE family efflux transporter [Fusobacterium mortiferum]|uniref:Multidrug export protein MepA n=1 Tax=Fusobacterium mortiferum ATCC 9817 TaxID=469616 RepID=A0ABN5J8E5_FUSMR|nr:MATE family efflux transporter [Fusobacterium mortiferum]AVQ18511.1 MATE family efflux transporter [Fusobacterium mortiferum ATCC 9817]EEO34750.1 MATE efflux family protein [Fusobacterium mortiferum ATCC 9817]MDD7263251.1 MATE family efflux transporter [Fusobacterium mortiferum]MDY5980132.1 MATE family efflux transporter [Fusobacterium mortiferum]
MFKAIDLKRDSVSKLFFNFSIPAVTGMMVNALYAIVDGIFIGQGVGADGLAAVNIAYPVINLGIAISLLIGTGGATLMSLHPKNIKFKNTCFSHIVTLNIISYIIILGLVLISGDSLIFLLGSSKQLALQVKTYLYTCVIAMIFLMLSNSLNAVVRNDKSPVYAFISMVIGAITNVFLDWLFIIVFKWGVFGGAFATAIGQLFSFLFLVKYFYRIDCKIKYKFQKLKLTFLKNIISIGFPSFTIEFTAALTNALFNISFMKFLGEIGVSAYCIVAYICYIFRCLFTGLSQGIQPVISYNYGIKEYERVKKTYRLGHIVTFLISSSILLTVIFFGKHLVKLFNNDKALVDLAAHGLILFASAIIFQGANFINISYLQSKGMTKLSNIISSLRSIVFFIISIIVLPLFLRETGVWLSLPASDLMCFIVSIIILRKELPFSFKFSKKKDKKKFINL